MNLENKKTFLKWVEKYNRIYIHKNVRMRLEN